MPFIDVTLGTGRSPEQVRALIHELTQAAHRAVGAPLASIRVVIREVEPAHWAAGDVTVEERNAQQKANGHPVAPARKGTDT
jgi:4-oxalocrotonate tautomerase